MGFNVGNYVKESAKTAGQQMVGKATSQLMQSLPLSAQALASTAAGSFLNIGASTDTIDTFVRSIVDDVTESAVGEFYKLASGNIAGARSKGADVNINTFLSNVNPMTKINKSKELDVIVVV